MDPVRNPYSPGAGTPPPALVGRDKQLRDMDIALRRLLQGRSAKSMMLTGLRGVGKTVLLNEFAKMAKQGGYAAAHLEVDETTRFPAAIAAALRRILLEISATRRLAEQVKRALGILKAFSVRLPGGPEFTIDVDAISGPADSGDLAADLAGLFCEVGEVARAAAGGVLLTVDEIQYLPATHFAALVMGLHRAAQQSLPITVAGAGLPSLPGLTGEAKSYAERMFDFPTIGSLTSIDAAEAIERPARAEGVVWEPGAAALVVAQTQGYPYFLQEFGKQTWDIAAGPTRILERDVRASVDLTLAELDSGFFRVRIDRATESERAYLRAMAELGPGPHTSAMVAHALGRDTRQVGPVRDSLIKRGLCYAPRWGQIGFTVPMFDGFMRRWMPSAGA